MIARVILAAVGILGILQGQAPTFRAGVEKVRVDVLVTRGGRPVTNLAPGDFDLLDNGVPQRIDGYGAFDEIPLNLVLAIDASTSVAGRQAELLRGACHSVLAELQKDDQAGLVVFGDAVVVRSGLSGDIASVRAAVDRPLPPGQTALADAVRTSLLLAESDAGRSLVLVFSDGVEVSSYLALEAVTEAVRRSDAVVYAVVPRGATRPPFLGDLAEASAGGVIEIGSALDVGPAFSKVLEEFRHRYLLSYTPTGVEGAGWHELKVRVRRSGVSVKARPGYLRE
jgi:VWFA-related protein